jgi:KUP system potassium uptake protein
VYAFDVFAANKWHGFAVLGSVFLAVTGGEVLYADMGHFGKKPIRIGWFTLVLPALILNYFGQGAFLLKHKDQVENLFYRLSPQFLHYPMVILATMATIIASQAVISGAFSLGRQALQLGFFPRMRIIHTSSMEIGQVYLPAINVALFVGTVVLLHV